MGSMVSKQSPVDLWVWEFCCRVISPRYGLLFAELWKPEVQLIGQESPGCSLEVEFDPGSLC